MPSSSPLNLMILKNQTQRQTLRERSYEKRLMLSKRTQIERDRERKVTVWVWRGLGKGKSSENTPGIRKQGKREKKETRSVPVIK